jgi:hypothetical protein
MRAVNRVWIGGLIVCNGIGMVEHLPHTRALRQALDNHYQRSHQRVIASYQYLQILSCLAFGVKSLVQLLVACGSTDVYSGTSGGDFTPKRARIFSENFVVSSKLLYRYMI